MTLTEIYTEILTRAGEGYDAYADRAAVMFWKAVSSIIQSGEYTELEIRKLLHRNSIQVTQNSFTSNRYSLTNWLGSTSGTLYDYTIFDYKVVLSPVDPDNCRFTEVPMDKLADKNVLNLLNLTAGLPEVIYAVDYPDIVLSSDTEDFAAILTLSTHSISAAAQAEGTTDSDEYFSYGFLVRAIELAAQLLKTETE